MWNTIEENKFAIVYVYQGICYLGRVVDNTDEHVVLETPEVYDHEKLYMEEANVTLDKIDVELMAEIRYMDLKERLM